MSSSSFVLPENIDYSNYLDICSQGELLIQGQNDTVTIVGGQIKHCNSAIFLIFFTWLRLCKEKKINLCLNKMPVFVRSMAQLYGLDSILSL